MGTEHDIPGVGAKAAPAQGGRSIRWDDSKLRSAYANVVHVVGTREEISVLFGTHKTPQDTHPNLQAGKPPTQEIIAEWTDRVFLNPYAAKRLHILLTLTLRAYESNYGPLKIEGIGQSVAEEHPSTPGR